MRNVLITLMVTLLSFGLSVQYADAARFGGGKTSGSMSRSYTPSKSPSSSPQQAPNRGTSTANQGGGMSRFLGPLAGLAAGSLLGAMLFGGGFHGFGGMDMILLAVVAFIAYRFLMRRRTANAHAGASPYQDTHDAPRDAQQPMARTEHTADAAPASTGTGTAGGQFGTPEWFNRERFLSHARGHFEALQNAWDANDLAQIQDYVTPQFYNELKEERRRQPNDNKTEVVRLLVELGGVQEFEREAEATVLFHGVLREQGQEVEFNETWHLIRDLRDGAPWYLQGIEQNR